MGACRFAELGLALCGGNGENTVQSCNTQTEGKSQWRQQSAWHMQHTWDRPLGLPLLSQGLEPRRPDTSHQTSA